MPLNLQTSQDLLKLIAKRAKLKRLELNLSQKSLSESSGVNISSLKKFEQSGKIALASLLKIALVLDSLGEFGTLFPEKSAESYLSLDELLKQKQRSRGRK